MDEYTENEHDAKLGQNCAAIAAQFFADPRFDPSIHVSRTSGWLSTIDTIRFAAERLTEIEEAEPDLYDGIDWYDLIDDIADRLIDVLEHFEIGVAPARMLAEDVVEIHKQMMWIREHERESA